MVTGVEGEKMVGEMDSKSKEDEMVEEEREK